MMRAVRWLINAGGRARVGAAFVVLSTLMPAAAIAGAVTCSPTKVKALASETFRFTTSTSFVRLAETGGKFIQGGSRPSCVIVRFEGYVGTSNNAVLTITASIDSKTVAPSEVQLTGTSLYEPRAWTFIIPNVAPGEHRINFKFRTNNGSNSVAVNRSNTIIHYAP